MKLILLTTLSTIVKCCNLIDLGQMCNNWLKLVNQIQSEALLLKPNTLPERKCGKIFNL